MTPTAVAVLIGGWLLATALIAFVLLAPGARVADGLAVAAVAALALTLTRGSSDAAPSRRCWPRSRASAPAYWSTAARRWHCAAASGSPGVDPRSRDWRSSASRGRQSRPRWRSRSSRSAPGLAGFALAYRATLLRGTADQAANRVPLDALVAAGPSFRTPLELAPSARWRALADGPVLPVRRTYADYLSGGASVTVDGARRAGLRAEADRRMAPERWLGANRDARRAGSRPAGPVRTPGPALTGVRSLAVPISAAAGGSAGDGRSALAVG